MKQVSKLHFITTNAHTAQQACEGGVRWVQLRMKDAGYEEFSTEALRVKAVCQQYGATFIINDNVQLAMEVHADGIHIGKDDMTPDMARDMLGDHFIIGCTANTVEDVVRLSAMPIDYIGLGPYRFTSTKKNLSPVLGLEGYQQLFNRLKEACIVTPPIIGIGGITIEDVEMLMKTGLYGIAVSGAIANAADVADAALQLTELTGR